MLHWLAGIDVNAVFLALMAAWGYLHNHKFRVAVANGAPPQMPKPTATGPAGQMMAVMCLMLIVLCTGAAAGFACSGSPKAKAEEQAIDVCLATAGAEFAVAAKAGSQSDGQIALQLSVPTVLCIWTALHVQAPAPTLETPTPGDAAGQ